MGWLQWGVTPMSFQPSVWSLNLGETSSIIETEYGFHLVVVDSIRSSEFSIYDPDSYEYAAQRSSLISVRDLLKDASLAYDREVLSERVAIHEKQINVLFEQMLESKKELLSLSQGFDFADFIKNLDFYIPNENLIKKKILFAFILTIEAQNSMILKITQTQCA